MGNGRGSSEINADVLLPAALAAAVRPSTDAARNVSASLDDIRMKTGAVGEEIGAAALFPDQAPAPALPVGMVATDDAPRNVSASMDDAGMGNGTGTAAAMEGIHASVARLDALFLEDHQLDAGTSAGAAACTEDSRDAVVDVLQRRYEIRLERLAGVSDCLCRRDVASGVIGESLWL
jgi:hypothetical protein